MKNIYIFFFLSLFTVELGFGQSLIGEYDISFGDYDIADKATYDGFATNAGDLDVALANSFTHEGLGIVDLALGTAGDSILIRISFGSITASPNSAIDTVTYQIQNRTNKKSTTMYSVKYGTTYTTNTDKSFSRTFKGVEGETDTIVIKTLGASNQLDFVNIWKGGGNPSDVISDTEGDLFGASGSISFSNPVVEENINFNILENDYASTLQLVNLEGSIVAESLSLLPMSLWTYLN